MCHPVPPLNSITAGDCRLLIPRLPDGSIDLVVTSPPYAEQRKDQYPSVPASIYPEFTLEWMGKLWRKLTPRGSVLIVIDPHVKNGMIADYVLRTQLALMEFGWTQHVPQIWYKSDRQPLGHRWWPRHCYEQILWFSKGPDPYCDPWDCGKPSDHLSVRRNRQSKWTPGGKPKKSGIARTTDVICVPMGKNRGGAGHPAQYPVALVEPLIRTFSPPDGTILDPFAGSGSTCVAAAKLGRPFYGFEIVPDFCDEARKRLDEANVLTG